MDAKILSVRTKGEKTQLVIIDVAIDTERKKYTVNEGTYRAIGCPLSGNSVSSETLASLEAADAERRAMIKALNILAYADNNERTLIKKLILAGFSRDAANDTAKECVRLGYINEERQMENIIIRCKENLLGPMKMMAKLVSRGFSPTAAKRAIYALETSGELNFAEMKKELCKSKLKDDASFDDKRKLLHKYGYIK